MVVGDFGLGWLQIVLGGFRWFCVAFLALEATTNESTNESTGNVGSVLI